MLVHKGYGKSRGQRAPAWSGPTLVKKSGLERGSAALIRGSVQYCVSGEEKSKLEENGALAERHK